MHQRQQPNVNYKDNQHPLYTTPMTSLKTRVGRAERREAHRSGRD